MIVEAGKQYQNKNNGEIVEAIHIGEAFIKYSKDDTFSFNRCIAFLNKKSYSVHILINSDFIEQYKPYELYEYKYFTGIYCDISCYTEYLTDEEFERKVQVYNRDNFKKVEETKRERKCD